MPKIWHVNGLANVENIWAIKENPPYHHSLFKDDVKKFCRGGRTSHISRTKSETALYYFSDQERFLKIRQGKISVGYQLGGLQSKFVDSENENHRWLNQWSLKMAGTEILSQH